MARAKNYRGPAYRCIGCDRDRVKLWRESNTILEYQELRCAGCAVELQPSIAAERRERMKVSCVPFDFVEAGKFATGGFCDQIGGLLPAVPTPDGATFWGYSSVPAEDVAWWYALPTYADPESDLVVERILRAHYAGRSARLDKQSTILDLARQVGEHWNDQEGVNGALLDQLGKAVASWPR